MGTPFLLSDFQHFAPRKGTKGAIRQILYHYFDPGSRIIHNSEWKNFGKTERGHNIQSAPGGKNGQSAIKSGGLPSGRDSRKNAKSTACQPRSLQQEKRRGKMKKRGRIKFINTARFVSGLDVIYFMALL